MARRPRDAYYTPEAATLALLTHVPFISGTILEPCAGEGHIVRPLEAMDAGFVIASDITTGNDARTWWPETHIDWVVTNPPFNQAFEIVQNAHNHCDNLAMLLRLSWLEPTHKRGEWLQRNPPNQIIVLPRISFTGDGKTDSVTCAWMVWEIGKPVEGIKIVSKQEMMFLQGEWNERGNKATTLH